jgi:hypothetical protein
MTMFKKLMFAVVPMLMLSGATFAGDDAIETDGALTIDASTIAVADANIVEVGLDIDVDQLATDAGKDNKTDAIEACFRRCGYNHCGWGGGYSSCYSPCYNSYYSSCYQPYYSCARPVYYSPCVYQPICQPVCQPVYSCYWGCF